MPTDKRQHKRVPFQTAIKAHPVKESTSGNVFEVQGDPMHVRSLNISEGGLRLELGDGVKPQMILKLNFHINTKKDVDVYAKVVWAEKGMSGLEFIVLDEPIRKAIRQYIEATA